SIIFAFIAIILLRGTPESKDRSSDGKRFDVIGIIVFVIMMVSVNVVITQGSKIGWLSPIILTLMIIFVLTLFIFYFYEQRQRHPFIDF
ncbi:MFS transporter, partial [Staphylococcus hominis]